MNAFGGHTAQCGAQCQEMKTTLDHVEVMATAEVDLGKKGKGVEASICRLEVAPGAGGNGRA